MWAFLLGWGRGEGEVDGGGLYRVRIGFISKQEGRQGLSELESLSLTPRKVGT